MNKKKIIQEKNMKKISILLIAISTVLVSCVSIAYQRLMVIEMGMSYEEVVRILLSDEYNDYDLNIISDIDSDTYDISKSIDVDDSFRIIITQKYYPLQDGSNGAYYILAFRDNKLIYWGLPMEFNRSDNELYQSIGLAATNIIGNKYYNN